jgi:hypothetical protein
MPDPSDSRFATFFNRKRNKINAEIFEDYLQRHHQNCTETSICETAIVIKCNAKWAKSNIPLTFEQRKILFEEVSEADTKNSSNQRCDPLLCLFYGSNLMGNENSDVAHGIANGTTCTFKKANLKPGTVLQPIKMHGFWVNSVCVDDVESLELEWQDCSRFQGIFRVFPEQGTFVVSYPITEQEETVRVDTSMCLKQFPVLINFATTGHKLQGKSMESLVIAEWSHVNNWAYVVISRVRTLAGLFFIKPIPEDIDFKPAPQYMQMMERLRETILANPEQVAALKENYDFDSALN